MKLGEHLAIIDNPVAMAVEEQDGTVLYRGYRGNFEHAENRAQISQREVKKFHLRVEGTRRANAKDKCEITELNCGVYNYADLHIALVYVYILA